MVVAPDGQEATLIRVVRVHKGMTVVMAYTTHGVLLLTVEEEAEAGGMRVLRIPPISPMVGLVEISTTVGMVTGV